MPIRPLPKVVSDYISKQRVRHKYRVRCDPSAYTTNLTMDHLTPRPSPPKLEMLLHWCSLSKRSAQWTFALPHKSRSAERDLNNVLVPLFQNVFQHMEKVIEHQVDALVDVEAHQKVLPSPPCPAPPPPPGRRFPPHGKLLPSDSPPPKGGGGEDTTPDQPLTGAYYVEFMAGQLLDVGRSRVWD